MSNNNPNKPAMSAIVSAAQKSVNNGKANNNNNSNTPKITPSQQTPTNFINISNKIQPPIQTVTPTTKETPVTQAIQAQKTPAVPHVTNTTEAIMKSATQTLQETLNKTVTPPQAVKPIKEKAVIRPEKEKPVQRAIKTTEATKDTVKPVINVKPVVKSTQVIAPPLETKEIIPKQEKNMPQSHNLNHHMVTILCEGIRNMHNQSLDFAEKINQRREQKVKSLCEIQKIACDNIGAVSNACFEAVNSSIKSKNPVHIIQHNAKAVTEVHKIYADMFANISKASIDIFKYNMSSHWLKQNNKK